MALLPILEYPDARLRTVARPVTVFDDRLRRLVADMAETMYDAPGVGLAASQVDVHECVIVIDTSDAKNELQVFINPEILWRSDTTAIGPEGCLSLPNLTAEVRRATSVQMRWFDLTGKVNEQTFTAFAAICVQHEFDHLNGVLTLDHLDTARRSAAERALA